MLMSTIYTADMFDGAMVMLAIFTLNLSNPHVLLCGLDDSDALGKDIDEQKDQDSHSAYNVRDLQNFGPNSTDLN